MRNYPFKEQHQQIRVLLIALYPIIQESLRLLLEKDSEISVIGMINDSIKLPDFLDSETPNIILIYLINEEPDTVKDIPMLQEAFPDARLIVLATGKDTDNQMRAVQHGASGIITKDQNSSVLLRAIKQIHRGDTWISQKLLAQVLNNGAKSKNGVPKTWETMNIDTLTEREREVIAMIGKGFNNKNISNTLGISEATVRHHLSSVYSKLGIEDRLNLIIYAYQHGLVALPDLKIAA